MIYQFHFKFLLSVMSYSYFLFLYGAGFPLGGNYMMYWPVTWPSVCRLPIIQGGCHKFIPAIAALMSLPMWKCPDMKGLCPNFSNCSFVNQNCRSKPKFKGSGHYSFTTEFFVNLNSVWYEVKDFNFSFSVTPELNIFMTKVRFISM